MQWCKNHNNSRFNSQNVTDPNTCKKVHFIAMIELKGMYMTQNFNVVVGKQFRTENAYTDHQYNIFIYRLTNVLLLFLN